MIWAPETPNRHGRNQRFPKHGRRGQRPSVVVPLPPRIAFTWEVVSLLVFGHVGLTIGAFAAYSLADRKWRTNGPFPQIDYRAVMVGAMLPDIVDKPLGLWIAPDLVDGSLRSVAHSLLFGLLVLGIASLFLLARHRPRPMILGVASSGHLLLDGMWSNPTVILWPFLGSDFDADFPGFGEWASGHFADLLIFYTDYPELLGFLVIVSFTAQILRPGKFRRFLVTGVAVSPPRIGP